MSDELALLIEIQKNLLAETEARTLAEINSANKTQELIEKREESIKLSREVIDSNKDIIENVKNLISVIDIMVKDIQPLDVLIQKIDILVLLIQLMIQIISKINIIDKEHTDKMNEYLSELNKLLVQRDINIHTIGTVQADQVNIAKNINKENG